MESIPEEMEKLLEELERNNKGEELLECLTIFEKLISKYHRSLIQYRLEPDVGQVPHHQNH